MALSTEGSCHVCGNMAFLQLTLVVFTPAGGNYKDAQGRTKRYAERVEKVIDCTQCGTRYIYAKAKDEWVTPSDPTLPVVEPVQAPKKRPKATKKTAKALKKRPKAK